MKRATPDDKDIIVVGDFNIPNTKSPLYEAVTSRGLCVPDALLGEHGSDLAQKKRYDQILHLPAFTKAFTGKAGERPRRGQGAVLRG